MSGTAVAKPRQVKWAERQLEYCRRQIDRTLTELPNDSALPRSIDIDKNKWLTTTPYDWTSGFWPGILWYNYENSDKLTDKLQALAYTERQRPLVDKKHVPDHDISSAVPVTPTPTQADANTRRFCWKEPPNWQPCTTRKSGPYCHGPTP